MNQRRRTLLKLLAHGSAAGALATGAPWVRAQSSEATRVLVGFPPGGLPDMLARAMTGAFDGVAIVDNRPGANGRLAAQAVKRAAPDGRTLLLVPASAMVHLPHMYKDLGYDPFADFTPVAQIAENDFAFAIHGALPPQNLKEFAAWCKANPERASFASPGQGSMPHFMGTLLAKSLGVNMLHVPYKGNAIALNDVGGGTVSSIFATTAVLAPLSKRGSLRMLGTTGRARNPAMPQVPTFREQGVDALTIVEGTWILAPSKTPPEIIDKLATRVRASLHSEQMQNVLNGQATAAPLGPQDVARAMRAEYERRGAAIRQSGFKADQ